MSPDLPLVVVSVGTDHHRFDRLVDWVDGWAATAPARVVIQHGSAPPPRHASGQALFAPAELTALMSEATVVVCHGGPGTIQAARGAGRMPVVVARDPAAGEHVDDHQLRFVSRMAGAGRVVEVRDRGALLALLDRALDQPQSLVMSPDAGAGEAAVARFDRLVSSLNGSSDADRLRVLFIAGWGRSGSTLLDRLLGQVPGVFSAGELRDVWQRGVVEDRLCGCGTPFRSCPVWREVGRLAFGGWEALNVAEVQRLRLRLDRPWSPPQLLVSRLSLALDRDVATYLDYLSAFYGAIREVTGARWIVDSSKIPTYALLLRQLRGIDLRAVHLVRDSRGVVFSWRKRVARADGLDADRMLRYGAASASGRYLYYNALSHGLRGLGVPYRLLRYEDLIAGPIRHLREVLGFAGIDASADDLSFLRENVADLAPNHTVDGNPMRLSSGPIAVRLDDAWRREMRPAERRLVTAVTAPLLAAYRYGLGISA